MTNTSQDASSVKIEGIEVFDVDVDYLRQDTLSSRIKHAGKVAGDYIVRYACTTIPADFPLAQNGLESFLQTFDNHLQQGAQTIGATVVDHTWGLVPRTSRLGTYYTPELKDFGINNYVLAARVMILSGSRIGFKHGALYNDLENKLQITRQEQLATEGWTSDAMRASQFTAQRQNGQLSLVLHDIEPRIFG